MRRLLLLLFLAPTAAVAALNLPDSNGTIESSLTLTGRWDSNIDGATSGRADFIWDAAARFAYSRARGVLSADATFTGQWSQYASAKGESGFSPSLSLRIASERRGRLRGYVEAQAEREHRPDEAVNMLVRSWNIPVEAGFTYRLTERISLTSDHTYASRAYDAGGGLFNQTSHSHSLGATMQYNSRWNATGNVFYRQTTTDLGFTSQDLRVAGGLSRPLTSKLHGSIMAGTQSRLSERGGGTFVSPFASVDLTWLPRRRWQFGLGVTRDFQTAGDASELDSTSVRLNGSYALVRWLTFTAAVGTQRSRFVVPAGRRDHADFAQAGVAWRINSWASLSLDYGLSRHGSDFADANYTRRHASLSVSLRR